MNANPTDIVLATVGWDGATPRPLDTRKYNLFGWNFQVVSALNQDTTFKVQGSPASAADDCVPSGAWTDVEEIATCEGGTVGVASITFEAGTAVGTNCGATIACRSAAFLRMVPVSGDTGNMYIVNVQKGPRGLY